ncbi:MAG: hypothetical protein Q9181_005983 [Wetmoreana brouardii]
MPSYHFTPQNPLPSASSIDTFFPSHPTNPLPFTARKGNPLSVYSPNSLEERRARVNEINRWLEYNVAMHKLSSKPVGPAVDSPFMRSPSPVLSSSYSSISTEDEVGGGVLLPASTPSTTESTSTSMSSPPKLPEDQLHPAGTQPPSNPESVRQKEIILQEVVEKVNHIAGTYRQRALERRERLETQNAALQDAVQKMRNVAATYGQRAAAARETYLPVVQEEEDDKEEQEEEEAEFMATTYLPTIPEDSDDSETQQSTISRSPRAAAGYHAKALKWDFQRLQREKLSFLRETAERFMRGNRRGEWLQSSTKTLLAAQQWWRNQGREGRVMVLFLYWILDEKKKMKPAVEQQSKAVPEWRRRPAIERAEPLQATSWKPKELREQWARRSPWELEGAIEWWRGHGGEKGSEVVSILKGFLEEKMAKEEKMKGLWRAKSV